MHYCRWETGEFGPCSTLCGGGEKVRPVRCVQEQGEDLVDVSESECTLETAPHAVEKCNVHHCPARYNNYPVNLLFTQTCIYYGGSFPKLFQMECLRARAMLSSVRARRG